MLLLVCIKSIKLVKHRKAFICEAGTTNLVRFSLRLAPTAAIKQKCIYKAKRFGQSVDEFKFLQGVMEEEGVAALSCQTQSGKL